MILRGSEGVLLNGLSGPSQAHYLQIQPIFVLVHQCFIAGLVFVRPGSGPGPVPWGPFAKGQASLPGHCMIWSTSGPRLWLMAKSNQQRFRLLSAW